MLNRKIPLKRKSYIGFKAQTLKPKKNVLKGQIGANKGKKRGKDRLGYWVDKADSYLTPIIKITTPNCEACNNPTEVAHHWIEKSRCKHLRYDFRNLIALCHSCHTKIHNLFQSSIVGGLNTAEIIIKKRGKEWKDQMEKESHYQIKYNIPYIQSKLEELEELKDYKSKLEQ